MHVALGPTELLETKGETKYDHIASTALEYVTNTTGNIFRLEGEHFILVSGRWFKSAAIDGPWSFVPAANMPADFARIPTNNPKATVLASVPGTPESKEALIANTIPQTATITRSEAKLTVQVRRRSGYGWPYPYGVGAGFSYSADRDRSGITDAVGILTMGGALGAAPRSPTFTGYGATRRIRVPAQLGQILALGITVRRAAVSITTPKRARVRSPDGATTPTSNIYTGNTTDIAVAPRTTRTLEL